MRLVNAIAKMYSPLLGQQLNGATDVCVSAGASEGTYLARPWYHTYGAVLIHVCSDLLGRVGLREPR